MKFNRTIHKDITEWDVRNWKNSYLFWQKEIGNKIKGKKVLEIGAGNGGLSLWAALNGADVTCSDIYIDETEIFYKHKKYDVQEKIEYKEINALSIGIYEEYDYIIFKSVLGGIGIQHGKTGQRKAINEIFNALKKGGVLLFAENLVSSSLHMFLRKRFIPWGRKWRYVTIEEIKDFFSIFNLIKYQTCGFLGAFGLNENQRDVFGIIDSYFFNIILPERFHYIIFGFAVK